jgi:hypothetical protein
LSHLEAAVGLYPNHPPTGCSSLPNNTQLTPERGPARYPSHASRSPGRIQMNAHRLCFVFRTRFLMCPLVKVTPRRFRHENRPTLRGERCWPTCFQVAVRLVLGNLLRTSASPYNLHSHKERRT